MMPSGVHFRPSFLPRQLKLLAHNNLHGTAPLMLPVGQCMLRGMLV